MMRSAVVAILALFLLSSCTPPPQNYRYKMTAEIETPEGNVSASVVRKLVYYYTRDVISQWGGSFDLSGNINEYGEALALDLPNGRTIFLLRDLNYEKAFRYGYLDGWTAQLADGTARAGQQFLDNINESREIYVYPTPAEDGYPRIVYFKDINDPKTVTEIDPENMSEAFGSGYRIKSLVIQMTDENLTSTIDTKLEWLGNQKGGLVKATADSAPEIRALSTINEGNFLLRSR